MEVNFYDQVAEELLDFAVIISKTNGKWVYSEKRIERGNRGY